VAVSSPSSASFNADFARAMSRKFEQGRFLIVGGDARKIQSQFAEAKREAVACSTDELVSKLSHQAATAHFETTVWFYPSERRDDERVPSALLGFTDNIVLMPGPGTDAAKRRADFSAVSSACMLTPRDVFDQVGGFDESLPGALADVDLCLKIRRADYLIVYTPFAKLYWHVIHGVKTDSSGNAILRQRWANVLERDPYYNPNLSRERADFSLAIGGFKRST
jgi:GT2 family glycosyltransferase